MTDEKDCYFCRTIAPASVPGDRIRVEGVATDGTGTPVKDALRKIWQADANGIYPHPKDPRVAEVALGFRS